MASLENQIDKQVHRRAQVLPPHVRCSCNGWRVPAGTTQVIDARVASPCAAGVPGLERGVGNAFVGLPKL